VVELTPDGYPKTIDEERMKKLSDIQSGMIASSVKLGPVYDFHEDNKDTFTNYIFLNCSSKFPKQIDGNEESDFLKHGVLYVRMGTDMGLVKTINFSRVTAPYLREALATREGEGKGTTIKQYYKAKVKMFGNNIFRPGDYIYISPNYTFVDRRVDDRQESLVDLEDALGIGGYYLVLDVHTSVNDFSYETEMNCSFQAHRKHVGKNHYLVIHKDEECKKR
jgi:hypothetical protein